MCLILNNTISYSNNLDINALLQVNINFIFIYITLEISLTSKGKYYGNH